MSIVQITPLQDMHILRARHISCCPILLFLLLLFQQGSTVVPYRVTYIDFVAFHMA